MQAGRVSAALRERLGDEATLGLLDVLESSRREWREEVLASAGERFEHRLTEQISAVRLEMAAGFAALRQEMALMRSEWHQELANARVDVIKWSFVFWIGQLVALGGLMAFMLRVGR